MKRITRLALAVLVVAALLAAGCVMAVLWRMLLNTGYGALLFLGVGVAGLVWLAYDSIRDWQETQT